MQQVSRMFTFVVLFIVGSAVGPRAQAIDPANGTWELNLTKSKFNPGPAAKSQTRTFDISGQSVKYTLKGIDAQGNPQLVQYMANYDGKDYPMTGSALFDAIAFKRVDAFTMEFTTKKAGKVVGTGRRVVSKDGKVMTVTSTGTNASGQALNDVLVFDKR